MAAIRTLTRRDARRLAIVKQHLDGSRRQRNGRAQTSMLDIIRDLGCVQLDPIRHVERTHRLVLWSRLGYFDKVALDQLRWQDRSLFEFWAHAASMVLTEDLPVHRWHMNHLADETRSRFGRDIKKWFEAEAEILYPLKNHILAELAKNGPMLSRDFEEVARYESRWSNGRYVSRVLDYLWSTGQIMVYGRPGNQRLWGLASQFWPDWANQAEWQPEQVTAFTAQKSIRALGVATPAQIKRHFTRNVYPDLNRTLKKLVAAKKIEPVHLVEKKEPLKGEWYLHLDDVPLLEQIQAGQWRPRTTILSPFDNLICDRERTEQLWDFYYRIEIYVPKAKREYGYYVLPILHNDELVGRIDAKMNRKTGTLELHNIYTEDKAPTGKRTIKSIRKAIEQLAGLLDAANMEWGTVPAAWSTIKD